MKYSIYINQIKMQEWELTFNEASVLDWLISFVGTSEKIIIGTEIFFHASRNLAVKEIPAVSTKADTIYRLYINLKNKGLINYEKIGNKDCIQLLPKAKKWHISELGNKSEWSEANPSWFGNQSEETRKPIRNVSEELPTNNNTINNITNNNNLFSTIVEKGDTDFDANLKKILKKEKQVAPEFSEMMAAYFDWYKSRNSNIAPKIDGGDGNALKSIISYLKTIYNSKPEPKGKMEDEIKGMWSYILQNWNKMDAFFQKQTKLTQINSNLNNIINEIKNGKSKSNPKDKSADARGSRLQDAFSRIDKESNAGKKS